MKTGSIRSKISIGLLPLLLGICLSAQLPGQSTGFSIAYTEQVVQYSLVDPTVLAQMNEVEKEGFKIIKEVRDVQTTVDANSDVTTTVLVTETNAYEPWMTPATKIVSNKNGTFVYDANNNLLQSSMETEASQAEYLSIKNGASTMTSFGQMSLDPLTNAQIQDLRNAGATVTTLSPGKVSIVKGQTQIIYDAPAKTFEATYLEGGQPRFRQMSQFSTIEGHTVPVLKTESSFEVQASGLCVERVVATRYTNYVFTESSPR